MTPSPQQTATPADALDAKESSRTGCRLRNLAFAILLACVASRAFLAERSYRVNPVNVQQIVADASAAHENPTGMTGPIADRLDLTRLLLPLALLAAMALWLLGESCNSAMRIRHPWWAAAMVAFALLSILVTRRAHDTQSAWLVWFDQLGMVLGGFLAMQLVRDRRRFVLLAVVLAGVAATLGLKAIYQHFVEIPDQIAFYQQQGQAHLADDPARRALYELRLFDSASTGFLGMANPFASQLLVMLGAAGGLLVAKMGLAKQRKACEPKQPTQPGELPSPLIAAGLMGLGVALTATGLALTQSRGGILAGLAVATATLATWRRRHWLTIHWRKAMLCVAGLLLLGAGATAALGLSKGSLPSKTLAVRWFYWTGAAHLLRDAPWTGVGGGNFADAYLTVRRPQAEEQVQSPHNVVADALVQFGLPVGGLFLGLIVGVTVLSFKPTDAAEAWATRTASPPEREGSVVWILGFVAIAVVAVRWWAVIAPSGYPVAFGIWDAVGPGLVLAGALAGCAWFGLPSAWTEFSPKHFRAMRLGFALGAAAMLLHNLVTYSLWSPGVGLTFWVAIGAAACWGKGRTLLLPSRKIRLAALAAALAAVALGVLFLAPAWQQDLAHSQLRQALWQGDRGQAQAAARLALSGNPPDRYGPGNAAQVEMLLAQTAQAAQPASPANALDHLRNAERYAAAGTKRFPHRQAAWQLKAQVHETLARALAKTNPAAQKDQLLAAAFCWQEAVRRNPAEASLRITCAQALLAVGYRDLAQAHLDAAKDIDDALRNFDPASVHLLSNDEWAQWQSLQQDAQPKSQTP